MTSSENADSIDEEEAFAAFKRHHGLEDWTVRFTADELRAREMADEYRQTGFEVRVMPLTPAEEEVDPDMFGEFDDLEHDPLDYVQYEACVSCLEGTHVVLTKEQTEEDQSNDLLYEAD